MGEERRDIHEQETLALRRDSRERDFTGDDIMMRRTSAGVHRRKEDIEVDA